MDARDRDERDKQQSENYKHSKGLEVRTPLGGAVRQFLIVEAKPAGRLEPIELFLEGRTKFHFDLQDDFGDIPTTVSKSVEDLPASAREKKTAVINKNIMSSIATIISYIKQGSKASNKKMKRKVHGLDKDDDKEKEKKPAAPIAVCACLRMYEWMCVCVCVCVDVCVHVCLRIDDRDEVRASIDL